MAAWLHRIFAWPGYTGAPVCLSFLNLAWSQPPPPQLQPNRKAETLLAVSPSARLCMSVSCSHAAMQPPPLIFFSLQACRRDMAQDSHIHILIHTHIPIPTSGRKASAPPAPTWPSFPTFVQGPRFCRHSSFTSPTPPWWRRVDPWHRHFGAPPRGSTPIAFLRAAMIETRGYAPEYTYYTT